MSFFDVLLGAVEGAAGEGLRKEQERISMLRQQSLEQLRTANVSAARRQESVEAARSTLNSMAEFLPEGIDVSNMSDSEVVSFVGGPIFKGISSAVTEASQVQTRGVLGTDSIEAEQEVARQQARRDAGVFHERGMASAIEANMLALYGPQDDVKSEDIESLHDKFNKQAGHYATSFKETFGSVTPEGHVGAARVVSDSLFRDVGEELVLKNRIVGPNEYRSFMEDFTRNNRQEIVAAARVLGDPGGAASQEYQTRMAALREAAFRAAGGQDVSGNTGSPSPSPAPASIVAPEGGSIFSVTPDDVTDTTDMGTTRNRINSERRGPGASQQGGDSAMTAIDPMARARQQIGGQQELTPEGYEGALEAYLTQLKSGRGTSETRRRTINLIYQFISSQNPGATIADAETILEELLSGE